MKLRLPYQSSIGFAAAIAAVVILLLAPATIHGQDSPPAAAEQAPDAAAASHTFASLLGIMLVSAGVLIVLSVLAKAVKRPNRRKANYRPVLLDRLTYGNSVSLQEQITRASRIRPLNQVYERCEPETNLVFDEPQPQPEEVAQESRPAPAVHAGAGANAASAC